MPTVPGFVLHRMERQTQSRSDVSLAVPLDVETQSWAAVRFGIGMSTACRPVAIGQTPGVTSLLVPFSAVGVVHLQSECRVSEQTSAADLVGQAGIEPATEGL